MVIDREVKDLVKRAIKEDLGKGDITTLYVVPSKLKIRAKILAKQDLALCGLDLSKEVFKQIDKTVRFKPLKKEGSFVKKGSIIALLEGKASSILKAERVALNFLMQLSGIASRVREFVKIAKKYKIKILDTRKTIPSLRTLQKYAVRVGGGLNHRKGLWDQVIIKENHLSSCKIKTKNGFDEASLKNIIKNIKKTKKKVELEVENLKEFKIACRCKPDTILLDNFVPKNIKKAVEFRNKNFPSIKLEASGGIGIQNIKKFAQTKVDYISIGSLTHSPQAKDVSLEVD